MELKEYFLMHLQNEVTILSNNNKSMLKALSYQGNYPEINESYKNTLIRENDWRIEKIEYLINQLKENN